MRNPTSVPLVCEATICALIWVLLTASMAPAGSSQCRAEETTTPVGDVLASLRTSTAVVGVVEKSKVTEGEVVSALTQSMQAALKQRIIERAGTERQAVVELYGRLYLEREAERRKMTVDALIEREAVASWKLFAPEHRIHIAAIRQEIYDIMRTQLDELIERKLLEAAAEARGVSTEELVRGEVDEKVMPLSAADLSLIREYEAVQHMGRQSIDPQGKQILSSMQNARTDEKRKEYLASLRKRASVQILLEVPRLEVPFDGDLVRGVPAAPVQLVMFSAYECPYCAGSETVLDRIESAYGNKVAILVRDFPNDESRSRAAEAARCAAKQGKYWEFHDALFSKQAQHSEDDLKKLAASLGLDPGPFDHCLESRETKAGVDRDREGGLALGVAGTPTFFINGRTLVGLQPFDSFARIIDEELEEQGVSTGAAGSVAARARDE